MGTCSVSDFDLLQVVYYDVNGLPRGKTVPRNVAKRVTQSGLELIHVLQVVGLAADFPMSVADLMQDFSNGLYKPDLDTLVQWPWASKSECNVGQVIGHIIKEDGSPDPLAVRHQAQNQLLKLQQLGHQLVSSFSCQFTVYRSSGDTCEDFLGGDGHLGIAPYDSAGQEKMMLDICWQLQAAGVQVESWSAGTGPGRFEMTLMPSHGIQAADMACRLRHGIKSAVARHGYKATFMAHPPGGASFSALAFQFGVLSAAGENIFLDTADPDKLSGVGKSWLAGLLHHGPALTALCCPTVNCYQRLSRDPAAPHRLDWDVENSSAFLNVHVNQDDIMFEIKLASPACNPYLVFLATLAAGLDGVEKNLACPERNSPVAAAVPQRLETALQALHKDPVLEQAMSRLLFEAFIALKRDYEVPKFGAVEADEEEMKKLENFYYLSRI
ncbi:lengsin-like [Physella acuta]|uniref:lengsin-like n=1 Tax=Physella acuta TaxID=109671 RepID=UPI0027DB855F|nr:lengsin-like [Physella acuta]XP_059151721.1 lengsin-like [Physella acuta]